LTRYYTTTGQVSSSSFVASTSGTYQLAYSYAADGLPSTYADGARSETYGYDNLGRLTTWQPANSGIPGQVVSYRYDLDGSLTQRGWPGGTPVTYSENATSHTVTIGAGTTTYLKDVWGRIYDTPAVNLSYNELDEITRITPKPGTREARLDRDGFGNRVVTQYGNPFDGQPWWLSFTFDDLAELRTSNTGSEERLRLRGPERRRSS
jgi:hypothetical protein